MTNSLERLSNNPSILEGFTDSVERTIYISGKDWKERYDSGTPIRVIGFYKTTFYKEFRGQSKANHILVTSKGDVVLNGYGDLNARMEKIPPGACIMVEYVGEQDRGGPMPALIFEVRRNKSLDMPQSEVDSMLDELKKQQAKFEQRPQPKPALKAKEDFPF